MRCSSRLLACLAMCFHGFTAIAQERPNRPVLTVTRIDRPVRLSGSLDDPLWNTAAPVELPYEIQPAENTPAPERTEVVALYDEDNLYLGFRCYDSHPENIRAHFSDRDQIFSDDYVVVIIDTYSDFQRGYEFSVNPLGLQGDLMMTIVGEDISHDMIWESNASMTAEGWVAEMKIPFKSIVFPDKQEQVWGLNIVRCIPRESRVLTNWTKRDRNKANFMTMGGVMIGLSGIRPGKSFEVLPYMMGQKGASKANESDPTSGLVGGPWEGRVGIGLRYAPSSDFALNVVLNPDFSQVEADGEQISVNRTFALFYEEKRPFFLESAELIQTPMYYSRSINNPLATGRVVGKSGGLSYMYIGALDRNTAFVIPGEEESNTVASSLRSFANIGRVRYNFEDESYLGAMVFTRNLAGGHNYVEGLDWSYKFWQNWYFTGEGFASQTRELSDTTVLASRRQLGTTGYDAGLNGERYSGAGLNLELSKYSREYRMTLMYKDFSPTYQTYNGLFPLTDYRGLYLRQLYTLYPTQSFFTRVHFWAEGNLQWNHMGTQKEETTTAGVEIEAKGQINAKLSRILINNEQFHGVRFRGVRRSMFSVDAEPHNAFSFSLYANIGEYIYRTSLPVTGYGNELGTTITVMPTSRSKIKFSYDRARLSPTSGGGLLFDGYVVRMTGLYHFTAEFFLRAVVQYNSFGRSLNVYPLVSYKLNALSTFYLGFTNDYLNYGPPSGLASTNRQIFLKLQYLFRS